MARTSSREIRLAANAVVFEKANGPKDGILKALVVSKHGREKVTWLARPVLSKNTNELKTGAPGRFDRHRPMASTQIWGVSEAMSAIRVPRTRRETPSSNGMPRSRAETWIQARAVPGPERASRLRRGNPGLDSGPLGGLFSDASRPVSARSPTGRKRGTRKSRLETKTENEVSSALLARLW